MIGSRKVLALIPARGGSKGLPGKNLMPMNGRPLIDFSVQAARASRHVDRVVVSSDDEAILAAARACGAETPFVRPAALATDEASTFAVAEHALSCLPGYDVLVLLQPTSPLRTAADIDGALEGMAVAGAGSCVSVCPVGQSPYWMYRLGAGDVLQPVLAPPPGVSRRQDLPPVYTLNGAVYVADCARLLAERAFVAADTVAWVMPAERSIDIDTAADFEAFRQAVTKDAHV